MDNKAPKAISSMKLKRSSKLTGKVSGKSTFFSPSLFAQSPAPAWWWTLRLLLPWLRTPSPFNLGPAFFSVQNSWCVLLLPIEICTPCTLAVHPLPLACPAPALLLHRKTIAIDNSLHCSSGRRSWSETDLIVLGAELTLWEKFFPGQFAIFPFLYPGLFLQHRDLWPFSTHKWESSSPWCPLNMC